MTPEKVHFDFHHIPSVLRFIIVNKRRYENATIKSVVMREVDGKKIIPYTVNFNCQNTGYGPTMEDPVFTYYYYVNSVSVTLDGSGWNTLGFDEKLTAYALMLGGNQDITDNGFEFVVTDSNGKEYTSLVLGGDKIKTTLVGDESKHSFLPGYVYTFTLWLDDQLTLGGVSVNGWDETTPEENAGNNEMSLTAWCSTDTYKEQREALTELTLDGAAITSSEVANYMQANFATYFPNVTTLNITGTSLAQSQILHENSTVTTLIGNDVTSLPWNAFQNDINMQTGVTTYLFPNLETVGRYCFKRSYGAKNISLPKLKAFNTQLLFGVSVENACFASLTDFTGASQEFSTRGINLAFGATTEFNFGTSKTPLDLFQDWQKDVIAATSTLYLNGYEYDNADKENNTWRGVAFAAIKKYSEYTGKKD